MKHRYPTRGALAAAALALCFTTSLRARPADPRFLSFRDGGIYVDLTGSRPELGEGIDYYLQDGLAFRNYSVAEASTNPRTKALAQYSLYLRPAPEVLAQNLRLGLEYAVSNHFGIGYSIETTQVVIRNVPVTTSFRLMPWILQQAAGGSVAPTASPGGLDYLNATVQTVRLGSLSTANLDLALHAGSYRRIDPYLRLTLGVGPEASYMTRTSGVVGVRLFVLEHVYLQVEAFQSRLHIVHPGHGGGSSSDSSSSSSSSSSSGSLVPAFTGSMIPSFKPDGVQGDITAEISIMTERAWRLGVGMCY